MGPTPRHRSLVTNGRRYSRYPLAGSNDSSPQSYRSSFSASILLHHGHRHHHAPPPSEAGSCPALCACQFRTCSPGAYPVPTMAIVTPGGPMMGETCIVATGVAVGGVATAAANSVITVAPPFATVGPTLNAMNNSKMCVASSPVVGPRSRLPCRRRRRWTTPRSPTRSATAQFLSGPPMSRFASCPGPRRC